MLDNYIPKIECAFDNETISENFAHYLDCEAHTDVWRELYPTGNTTNEL